MVNEANLPLPDKENAGPFDILTEVGTSGRLHPVTDRKNATVAIKNIALVEADSCQLLSGRLLIEPILDFQPFSWACPSSNIHTDDLSTSSQNPNFQGSQSMITCDNQLLNGLCGSL